MALFVYDRDPISVLIAMEHHTLTPLDFREQKMVLVSFSSCIGFHVSEVKVPSLYKISSPYFSCRYTTAPPLFPPLVP